MNPYKYLSMSASSYQSRFNVSYVSHYLLRMRKGLKARLDSVIATRALLKLRRPPSCLMRLPNSASVSGSRTTSKLESEDRSPEEEELETGPEMELLTDDDKEDGEPRN